MRADESDRLPSRYDVTPYVADGGGGSIAGFLQLSSILSSVGILVGFAVSVIGQWFYLILIFPILMGFAIGFVGAKTIQRYHIRRPILCGCAGFAAGCFCLLANHYSDYLIFEWKLSEFPEELRQIARDFDKLTAEGDRVPEDLRKLMAQMQAIPGMVPRLSVSNFLDFMNFEAEQGVTISGHGGGNGFNLGYAGSIVYWLVEAMILAFFAMFQMRDAASKPYCLECSSWKKESPLFFSPVEPKKILKIVREGDISELEQLLMNPPPVPPKSRWSSTDNTVTKVAAYTCPNCESEVPFEVAVVLVQESSGNQKSENNIGTTTYPRDALVPLLALVARQKESAAASG